MVTPRSFPRRLDRTIALAGPQWCGMVSELPALRERLSLSGGSRSARRALVLSGRELMTIESERHGRWTLRRGELSATPFGLTVREIEVLAELAQGSSNREIAGKLHTSERTVTSHVEHILTKTGANNRTKAAAEAHRVGFDLPPIVVKPAPAQ